MQDTCEIGIYSFYNHSFFQHQRLNYVFTFDYVIALRVYSA